MSKSVAGQYNVVQHKWPIVGDDVTVYLTVQSREPLDPEAYAPIKDVVVAGDLLAEAFEAIAIRKAAS